MTLSRPVLPSWSLYSLLILSMLAGCRDDSNVGNSASVPQGNAGGYSGVIDVAHGGTGATTSDGAIANLGLGTSAKQNVGIGPLNVLQLDSAGLLPAVDGSNLKNVRPSVAVSTKTASYTMAVTDGVVTADATAGTLTVTLPDAAISAGKTYTIKKIDASANPITVSGAPGQSIDGSATYPIAVRYRYVALTSDGGNWNIVGGGGGTPSCSQRTAGDLTTTSATASCIAPEVRTGGGCEQSGSAFTYQYYPVGTLGFYCSSGSSSTTVKAYAICCTFN